MKPISQQTIALIGGAGFIGHNLALHLKALGADVYVIDGLQVNNLLHFSSGQEDIPNRDLYLSFLNERLNLLRKEQISLFVQDARDYLALSKLLGKIQPDSIVVLAAVAHADKANKDPYSTFDHSLRTLENALDYARGAALHRFVYFSSSMVYGNFKEHSVDEESQCHPLGIYGALKLAGEKLVEAYNQVFDLPYTIIRPSALYGERCVSRRVSQVFIENALDEKEVVIKGTGSDRLDFTYVQDLIQGVTATLIRDESLNQIFNITYGESRSIYDMSQILKKYFPNVQLKFEPKDHLTPSRGTLCVDKARSLLGYTPQFPIEKGYSKYIEWYMQRFLGIENTDASFPRRVAL